MSTRPRLSPTDRGSAEQTSRNTVHDAIRDVKHHRLHNCIVIVMRASAAAAAARRRLRAVLVDLSGTVHVGDEATPGAAEALDALRAAAGGAGGVRTLFVPNTSKEGKAALVSRLGRAGLRVRPDEIQTALSAASDHVRRMGYRRPLLMLQDDAKLEFGDGAADAAADADDDDTAEYDAVVVGHAPDAFAYAPVTEAFRALRGGAALVALNKGRYFQTAEGLVPGPGALVAALEYASGREAAVCGKPSRAFYEAALARVGCEASEAIMIGDDARADARGAREAGMLSCLVQTGKYASGDESAFGEPDVVAPTFADAVAWILEK